MIRRRIVVPFAAAFLRQGAAIALVGANGCYDVRDPPLDQVSAVDLPPADDGQTMWEPDRRRPNLPPITCDETPSEGCVSSFPRIMIVMDASSSMLAGRSPGENNWDKARFALAGNPEAPSAGQAGYVLPAFERRLDVRGNVVTLQDVFHLGMLAFNRADTQRLMLQYASCATDNLRWAMDPETSCEPPGCTDPYADDPEWTFKNSDVDREPPFVETTLSYMPPCNPGGPDACVGNQYNTYTREGLEAARDNIEAYRRMTDPAELAQETRFANILITDGDTAPDSPPVAALETLADEGVPTYVIGLQGGFVGGPDATRRVLDGYARAGGTEEAILIEASDVNIADAFAGMVTRIIDELGTDPCCQPTECATDPEPGRDLF